MPKQRIKSLPKRRKPTPPPTPRAEAAPVPTPRVEAAPKKAARVTAETNAKRPRTRKPQPVPSVKDGVRKITVPVFLNPPVAFVVFCYECTLALGGWSRQRAGMLVLVGLLSLALWWQWISYAVSKPLIASNCDTIAYARVVTVDRGCRSEEHCTEQQIADVEAAEVVFDVVANNCFAPEPWSPHMAVYRTTKWAFQTIKDEPGVQDSQPPQEASDETVVVAENS